MSDPQTLREHAALVDRMSGAAGVDLEEMILRGQLQIDTLGDAVLACTGCANPEGCRHWLDRQERTGDVAETSPGFCRNTDLFRALKQGDGA
ncbi:DUF6455 family protein [Rhodobacteraceae bacterium KMM 6894]|nr:DUF6455 family protein [Rhodobacteraceae bacterium KMM 6894]